MACWLEKLPEDKLRQVSGRMLQDLKEARDRLNQTPDNSSRPPSSRAPWEKGQTEEKAATPDESEDGAKTPRETEASAAEPGPTQAGPSSGPKKKPGRQPGAPGHGRTSSP